MPPLDTSRATLLKLSHELGAEDRALAILGEGNTSIALDEACFLVKASGSSLSTLAERDLVACRSQPLLDLMERESVSDDEIEKALYASRSDAQSRKPSVEALFHAYLLTVPGVTCVGHTHPVAVNSLLCSGYSQAFAHQRRFPDEIVCCGPSSVLVPYCDPGFQLARKIRDGVSAFLTETGNAPRLVLLENHGLIALGGSAASVLAGTLMAEKSARIFQGAAALGPVRSLSSEDVIRISSRSDEHYRQRALQL